MSEKNGTQPLDYLVVGAGPGGLQLGYFLHKSGHRYQILEAGDSPGSFFKKFPRHRTLISNNKVYTGYTDPEKNMRWDWNSLLCDNEALLFKNYSKKYFPPADQMVRYLQVFAAHYQLNVQCDTRVVKVTKNGDFHIQDNRGQTYTARRLIMATGVSKPYIPRIVGVELAELYTEVSVEPQDFVNKRVLIIGKSNSAFETAENLIETAAVIHLASPHSVSFAWKTHYVGHLRAVNNNFVDTYQLKSQNAILDCSIDRIEKKDGRFHVTLTYQHAFGEQETLIYDRVILCTGFRFDASIFDETCRPELAINDRFPRQTSQWESVNVPGLYFAGTVNQQRDFKHTTSGFIHGLRYNARALYRIFERKYHGNEWPHRRVPRTAAGITKTLLERVNTNSGLWQQFGFLCDVLSVPEGGDDATYYEELPTDFVHDSDLGQLKDYYVMTLEYGDHTNRDLINPVGNYRPHKNDAANAHLSPGLHPIIRRYSGDKLVAEHHVIEDLYAEWFEDVHLQPLLKFFENQLMEEPSLALA
jgi:cation diffusion facilitator CzcD-associated flavoprotein CzcO